MFLRATRWVPANGILFALLVIVAFLLVGDRPGDDATNAALTEYYADDDNRMKELASLFCIGLAGLCFLSFLGSFRGLLARAEGEPNPLTTAATASGATFIALAVAAHAIETAPAIAVEAYDALTLDPNTARLFLAAAFALFIVSLFAAAAMALASGVLALQTGVLPRWLAYTALVAALAGVLSFFVPFASLVVLAWIVALSGWMLVSPSAERSAMPTTTA